MPRLLAAALAAATLLIVAAPAAALAPGDPDPTFGSDGVVYYALGGTSRVNAVALQPDGKIVLAGQATDGNGNPAFMVARLNPDGSLDQSFGDGGTVVKQFGIGTSPSSVAHAVAVQPDGAIVVGTEVWSVAFNGLVAVRLDPNGSLDPSFGEGGKVFTEPDPLSSGFDVPAVYAVAVQPDGKILLGGTEEVYHAAHLLLERLNGAGGSFDSSFGDGGRILLDLTNGTSSRPFSQANALTVQPDGKIVVAGTVEKSAISDLFVGRLNGADGGFDTSFGEGGKVLYGPFGDECGANAAGNALGLQPDGNVVVAGSAGGPNDCNAPAPIFRAPGLALRLLGVGGGFDPSFGDGGSVFTDTLPGGPAHAVFYGAGVRPDGKLIVAGATPDPAGKNEIIVARLNGADGSYDPTFGSGGKILRQLDNGAESEVRALALQPDGKIVAAGFAGPSVLVTRLVGDPTSSSGGGGDTGGSGGAGNNVTPSTSVATLSKLGIVPAVFSAADSGPTISRTVGAQVSYEDTAAVTTLFTVFKRSRGVLHKHRCMKPSRRRSGKRCTRWPVVGRFTHADRVGLNSFHFSGRLHGRKLKPGRYRLRARPRFAGPTGQAIEVRFRIVS